MTAKTKYIDVAETAKIIRTTLKSQFPDTKFSVKSKRYAGGSSIIPTCVLKRNLGKVLD